MQILSGGGFLIPKEGKKPVLQPFAVISVLLFFYFFELVVFGSGCLI